MRVECSEGYPTGTDRNLERRQPDVGGGLGPAGRAGSAGSSRPRSAPDGGGEVADAAVEALAENAVVLGALVQQELLAG
jgi:hypothetical protein